MNPNLSQQTNGWYDNRPESPTQEATSLPAGQQFARIAPNNSLGLESRWDSNDSINPPSVPAGPSNGATTYYAAEPITSRYIDALMRDTESGGGASLEMATTGAQVPPAIATLQPPMASIFQPPAATSGLAQSSAMHLDYSIPPSIVPSLSPFPLPRGTQPSPTYSLRRVSPSKPPGAQPPRFKSRAEQRQALGPATPPGKAKEPHRRKRVRTDDLPGSSDEEFEDLSARVAWADQTRPSMLLTQQSSSASIRSATQHLADPRPIEAQIDSDEEMERHDNEPMAAVDEAVVPTFYGMPAGHDASDLRRLCSLVDHLLKTQAHLAQNIKQIDARTQQYMDSQTNRPLRGSGTYVSPPEVPPTIDWDQSIPFDAPAGRQRRATRRVLLMGVIRDTIFRLLSRRSVHDALPPPPPPSLRVPRPLNFGIRWHESSKSIFNQTAAQVVAQQITYEQPTMLDPEEVQELPQMVTRHIKYLCRCYKEQNREDAQELAAERLKRCSAGTRKRQLFATRLQVIDKFPQHLGKHRRLIVHLGVEGTSSDEEDPNSSGTYKIKTKRELSSKVTLLKRDLDHVYQLYFKGPGTKGSQVHRRVPSNIDSTRPFLIQGLPLPCVSRSWYQSLEPAEQEFYRLVAHDYDFAFPVSLFNLRNVPFGERARDVSP